MSGMVKACDGSYLCSAELCTIAVGASPLSRQRKCGSGSMLTNNFMVGRGTYLAPNLMEGYMRPIFPCNHSE